MSNQIVKINRGILVTLFFGIILFILVGIDIPENRLSIALFNFGHLPLFGLLALVILITLNKGSWPVENIRYYYIAGAVSVFIGFLIELIQIHIPGRFFELQDIILNFVGTATFLILSYTPGRYRKWTRIIGKSFSLIAILIAMSPVFIAIADTWQMQKNFPLINSFETSLEISRWEAKCSTITRSIQNASDKAHSLKILLDPATYPGASTKYFVCDWRGFTELCFDVFLTGESPIPITVRIDDKDHKQSFDDRYNGKCILNPGMNHIAIDLEDIRTAPTTRTMDMENIVLICLFSYELKEQRTLYIDNMRLIGEIGGSGT